MIYVEGEFCGALIRENLYISKGVMHTIFLKNNWGEGWGGRLLDTLE